MGVRDTKGNPRTWEQLSWADMSSEEQAHWAVLGWQEDKWDGNDAPASADKEWSELTLQEQRAATALGFSESLWNATEDE